MLSLLYKSLLQHGRSDGSYLRGENLGLVGPLMKERSSCAAESPSSSEWAVAVSWSDLRKMIIRTSECRKTRPDLELENLQNKEVFSLSCTNFSWRVCIWQKSSFTTYWHIFGQMNHNCGCRHKSKDMIYFENLHGLSVTQLEICGCNFTE